MPERRQYIVTWSVPIEALDPYTAAHAAAMIAQDPTQSLNAPMYTVSETRGDEVQTFFVNVVTGKVVEAEVPGGGQPMHVQRIDGGG